MRYLNAHQVIRMHDELLARWGGEEGVSHRGPNDEGVEAAVQAVKNSYYEATQELAAAYAVYIVQGHVFMDGNKRTAACAMLTFATGNGVDATVSPRRLQAAMVEVQQRAENGESSERLVYWLAEITFG